MFMGMWKKPIIFYISGSAKLETDFLVVSKNEKRQDF